MNWIEKAIERKNPKLEVRLAWSVPVTPDKLDSKLGTMPVFLNPKDIEKN